MRKRLPFLLLLVFAVGCSFPGYSTQETQEAPTLPPDDQGDTAPEPASEKRCGDGICDGPENADNCPQDCADESAPADVPSDDEGVLWVTNPTSGSELAVFVFTPSDWDGTPLPTLILVPGGIGTSADFTGQRRSAQGMADQGYAIVTFDPEGRGASGGEEDLNGHVGQDGLAAVVRTISSLPQVDASRIGLVSFSFGVTLASGTLARYPELPVLFFIDWEGPANRVYTTHGCSADAPGIGSTTGMAPCEDDAFWSEREAETFIASVQVPYQRLQWEDDHSQDDATHALVMVNAAVAGSPPWVRLNDDAPNQTYALSPLPRLFPGGAGNKLDDLVVEFAAELFATFAP